jgi:cobalt-zinc-cadmium resistance protein CzcA
MANWLIDFALRQRILVVAMACMLAAGGLYALQQLNIDAFPDVTNIQVQVITEAVGRSPLEVERFITIPLEIQMTGLPGLTELRSISKFGLSLITIVFRDDVDLYLARQLVLERVLVAQDVLPSGLTPVMGPASTGLGEIFRYTVERVVSQVAGNPTPLPASLQNDAGGAPKDSAQTEGVGPQTGKTTTSANWSTAPADLQDIRTIQDWVIRPYLKGTIGVTEVNSHGGYVKQYHVLVDPDKLKKYALTLREVFESVSRNNSNAGGNILEHHAEKYLIRAVGLIQSLEDVANIVVKEHQGVPIYIKDVAEVEIGHEVRHGAAVKDGKGEVVVGIVLMLRGGNAKRVVDSVKQKIKEMEVNNLLPSDVRIVPFYDRTELVDAALWTVKKALGEGIVLVVMVLFVFLGNIRSALIVMATLILAPLMTFIGMLQIDLSANLMSLGGLAVAIGMMVDGSVVIVENVYRHLSEQKTGALSRAHVILEASREVARPVVFGIMIIVIVFLPLFTLEGLEGKLFAPMAYTTALALFASLAISLTLSPVLCSFFLKGGLERDNWLLRKIKGGYLPALRWSLQHRMHVLAGSVAGLALSLLLVPFLGTEFIPMLFEGAITPQVVRLPSIALQESIDLELKTQRAVMEFPEVRTTVAEIGRAEIATSPIEANESDQVVLLTPVSDWTTAVTPTEFIDTVRNRLQQIPGISILMSMPIQERVDELISGIKTQLAVKIFGDDLELLREKAEQTVRILSGIRGAKDIKMEQVAGQQYLTIDIDRRKVARYGINVADIQEIVETAIGGKEATEVFEGQRRFSLVVRFPRVSRDSPQAISNILVSDPSGARIPLAQLADISLVEGPAMISHQNVKRRIIVGLNVVGRDIGGFVNEAQGRLASELNLPSGFYVDWGGAFENMQRAMKRLAIIVPLTIMLIFFLLFSTFNSMRYAALIILNLPFAVIGGILGLWLSGQYLSVPASVGFITLFGVAVLNGLVLVSYINQLRREGMPLEEALLKACERRLRPVLMTASLAILGLVPLLFATGVGSEVQRPLAAVVIGGLVSSTLLTLLVLPTVYGLFEERRPQYQEIGR